MIDDFKVFHDKVLDSMTPSSEARRLFCRFIREHAHNLPLIIQAMGLLYVNRSSHSQPPSDDARFLFRNVVLPFLRESKNLVAAFYLMIVNRNVPNICIMAIVNEVKKEKNPWWLIGVAVNLRPSFADCLFRRRATNLKRAGTT